MTPPVNVTFGNPDPTAAPINIIELVQLLNTLVSGAIGGSYIPYIIDSVTPGADQQDQAWIQTDSAGRPLATKIYYNGNWRRIYNGMLGEVRGYNGDPSVDFDTNGLGLIGGTYDGWGLCNGVDGRPNYTDKFMVAGHLDNSNGHVGYDNGWQTFVDTVTDLETGGSPTTMVQSQNLPPFDAVNGLSQVVIHGSEDKDDADHSPDVQPLISPHYANLLPHDWTIGNYGSNPNGSPPVPQVALPTLPPFIAFGLIVFVGYA